MSLTLRLYISLIIVIGSALLKQNAWSMLSVYGVLALIWASILRARLSTLR